MMWIALLRLRMRDWASIASILLATVCGPTRAQEAKPVKTLDLSVANWRGWCHPAAHFGGKWGVPEMWWYGKAKVFRSNAETAVTCRNCGEFLLRGRAHGPNGKGLFGVELEWGRPMERGNAYKFVMAFRGPRNLPDFVTVNDRVVWRRADGFAQKNEAHFPYVPTRAVEPVTLRLFWECGAAWREVDLFHNWRNRSLTAVYAPYTGAPPVCDAFPLPEGAEYDRLDPHMTADWLHDDYFVPTEYNPPALPKPGWPTDDIVILQRGIAPDGGAKYLRLADIQTLTFQPNPHRNEASFEKWAKAAVDAGVRNLVLTPVLEVCKTYDPKWPLGEYRFYHLHSFMGKGGTYRHHPAWSPEERIEKIGQVAATAGRLMRRWLELCPEGGIYFFEVETNGGYADYGNGINGSLVGNLPGYDSIRTAPRRDAYNTVFGFYKGFRRQIEDALGEHAPRLKVIGNFDRAGFQGAYAVHSGVDVVVHKCIHRQNINIVVANSRGAARAYGKEFGYDFDAWDRNYWHGQHPGGVRHGLMVFYHAGARYLMNEIPIYMEQDKKLSGWGPAWFDVCRYARLHPRRGEPQVRIAVMRALGDEWNRAAAPSSGWESGLWLSRAEIYRVLSNPDSAPPSQWVKAIKSRDWSTVPKKSLWWEMRSITAEDTYLGDYNLLDILFAHFGNAGRTEMDRLCTGTPYGPVDFLPWDTPLDRLKSYKLIVHLGRGVGPTKQEIANLEQYVKEGGRLFIAGGQLRGEDDRLAPSELCGVGIEGSAERDGLPYVRLRGGPKSAEVLGRLPSGDPDVVRARFGQGVAYVFSGEWLAYWGREAPERLLRAELEKVKWLDLTPASGWIEYAVRRKGKTWIFALFNHGRGFFPSGNGRDHGPWEGGISTDLSDLGLLGEDVAVLRAEYTPNVQKPFALVPVLHTVNDGHLEFQVRVEDVAELIIGPSAEAETDFFR